MSSIPASVDATMATWGGSTVDNLENITEDEDRQERRDHARRDEDDEDDGEIFFFFVSYSNLSLFYALQHIIKCCHFSVYYN